MNSDCIETIRFVIEDLEDLFIEFGGDDYIDSKIRKSSATLNMLLVENNLLKVYKLLFGSIAVPKITAPNLDLFIKADFNNILIDALAGGAELKGIQYALYMKTKGPTVNLSDEKLNPIEYKFNINKYIDSTGIILNGNKISRSVLIKYIANKKGGKHIDHKRNFKKDIELLYRLLDERLDFFIIEDKKNAVYLELHSIIQSLQNSHDIKKLIKKGKQLILEHEM